jgi:hypothetical protein
MAHSRSDNPYNQKAFAVNTTGTQYVKWDSPITWTMGPGGYSGTIEDTDPNNDLIDLYGLPVPTFANTKDWSSIWPSSGTSPEGYSGHSYTETEIQAEIKKDIEVAFAMWAEVADISFIFQAWDPNANPLPDIIIWCGELEVGVTAVAHAYYGEGWPSGVGINYNWDRAGDIHIHNAYRWYSNTLELLTPTASTEPTWGTLIDPVKKYNITTTFCHEIGHSLGLGHVTVPGGEYYGGENSFNQTMSGTLSHWNPGDEVTVKKLGWGDIDGIQAIFGANTSWVEPTLSSVNDTVSLDLNNSYSVSNSVITNDTGTGLTEPVVVSLVYHGSSLSIYDDDQVHSIMNPGVSFTMGGTCFSYSNLTVQSYCLFDANGILIGNNPANYGNPCLPCGGTIIADSTTPTTIVGTYGTLTMLPNGAFDYVVSASPASTVSELFTYMIGNTNPYPNVLITSVAELTINITPDTSGGGTPPPGISLLGIDAHLGNWDTSPSVIKFSDYTLGSESLPSVKKNTDILTLSESKQLKEFSNPSNIAVVNIELTSSRVTSITEDVTSKSLPIPPLDGTTITGNFDIGLNFNHAIQSDSGHLPYFKYSKWKGGAQIGSDVQLDMVNPINGTAWNLNFNYQYSLGDENLTNKIKIDIEDFATGSLVTSDYLISFYACEYAYDITYSQIEMGYWDEDGHTWGVWGTIGKHLYNTLTNWKCGVNAGPDYQSVQGVSYLDHTIAYEWCHGFNSRGTSNNPDKYSYPPGFGFSNPSGTTDQQKCFDPTDPAVIAYCASVGTCVSCQVDCPAWARYDTTVPLNEQEGDPWGGDGPCVKGIDAYYGWTANGGYPIGTYQCQMATCSHEDFGVDESSLVWEYVNGIALLPDWHTSPNPPCLELSTHTFSAMQLPTSSTPTALKDWFDSSQPLYAAWGASVPNIAQYLDANLLTGYFNNNTCSRGF